MARRVFAIGVLVLVLAGFAATETPSPAVAQDELSPYCAALNDPWHDTQYRSGYGYFFADLLEGEVITISAGPSLRTGQRIFT